MQAVSPYFPEVRNVIVEALGLEESRRAALMPDVPLFGGIPELDSFAVLTLVMALEERFGFTVDDSDFTAEIFDTVGSLSDFVEQNCSARQPTAIREGRVA